LIGIGLIGCGQSARDRFTSDLKTVDSNFAEAAAVTDQSSDSGAEATDQAEENQTNADLVKRRIIYNTGLSLIVKDYQVFETQLPTIVEKHGGFIAKSETSRRFNDQQSGMWVARIPVRSYSDFMRGVTGLGFAESRHEDAQDVTDQYVDVEARIRNNRKLEDRIITLLAERTGKLTDILQIERELSRVREEIERMEGRLRVLADRSNLATITIQCREEKEYLPPKSPTFVSRVTDSWSGSLVSLRRAIENLLVFCVAVIPWLVTMVVPVAIGGWVVRRSLLANSDKNASTVA